MVTTHQGEPLVLFLILLLGVVGAVVLTRTSFVTDVYGLVSQASRPAIHVALRTEPLTQPRTAVNPVLTIPTPLTPPFAP